MSKILQFVRDENGATAIEYGLIAAGISVAIIVAVTSLGSSAEYDLHLGANGAEISRTPAGGSAANIRGMDASARHGGRVISCGGSRANRTARRRV